VRPDLPQDLETIVGKALEKEPGRRYADAGALAADLRRFLAERPVVARRPTTLYQLGKLVRRNRALALATLAVILALATGLAFALAGLRRARAEQAFSAETLDAFATQMAGFAEQLGVGEEQRAGFEAVVTLVERQLARGGTSRALRAGRARMLYELASLHQAAERFAEMDAHLAAAQEALEELESEDPSDLAPRTLLSYVLAKRGEAARGRGDEAAVERYFARALALDEELVREHPGDGELLEDLGWSLERVAMLAGERGDFVRAAALHRRRLADAELLARQDADNWKYLLNLSHAQYFESGIHYDERKLDLALPPAQASVDAARRLLELQPARRAALVWLAHVLRRQSQIASELGKTQMATDTALEAFGLAEQLVLADPHRSEHQLLLRDCASELVGRGVSEESKSEVRRTLDRLRRMMEWLGPRAHRSELARAIEEIESWTD